MNTCKKCGCDDAYPSLPPCPTPVDCPNPQPCAEFFDADCVVYTGEDLMCGIDVIIPSGSSVAQAFADLILYLQNNGALNCPSTVCVNAYTYITNTVLASVNLPSVTPLIALTNFLDTGIVISNGTGGICCPTCGPYIFSSNNLFLSYYERVEGAVTCCNNIYATIETYNNYIDVTGGTLSPCSNGFTTAATNLAVATGDSHFIMETGIVENGSLNADGSTNIPNLVTMIDAFIAVDPTTTYFDIVNLLLERGLVVECCTDTIIIASVNTYSKWLETGGCNPPA